MALLCFRCRGLCIAPADKEVPLPRATQWHHSGAIVAGEPGWSIELTLNKRIVASPRLSALLAGLLGRLIAGWVRLCHATTRWERRGDAELLHALAQGPVILVLWHESSLMGPRHWPIRRARLSTLRDTSPIGMVSGAVQTRFGLEPVAMTAKGGNRSASRAVMRRLQEGSSIGMTGDGPLGPARVMKSAPLDWARATGVPVFLYAYAMKRHRRVKSWDKMVMPLPFTSGVSVYRRWDADVPRRADAAQVAALAADMGRKLDAVTQEADAACR